MRRTCGLAVLARVRCAGLRQEREAARAPRSAPGRRQDPHLSRDDSAFKENDDRNIWTREERVMSKKFEGTYRLAGGITVTDADLDADAQRFEAGECDGAWKVLPGRPQLFGEDTMPVGTRLPESLVRELDEAAGELGQTRSELVRRFISDGLLALKA